MGEERSYWHTSLAQSLVKKRHANMGKMLNRGGNFKMSVSTKFCSNHFATGYCPDECSIPILFLKGYADEPTMKWEVPIDRTNIVSPRKKHIYHCNGFDNTPLEEVEIRTAYINEHEYKSATTLCVSSSMFWGYLGHSSAFTLFPHQT